MLTRRFRVQDAAGRRTAVAQRRVVSMADPYLACLDATFVAENWSGALVVRSGIDGRVTNSGVPRYRGPRQPAPRDGRRRGDRRRHRRADRRDDAVGDPGVAGRPPAGAARRQAGQGRSELWSHEDGYIGQDIELDLREGERHTIEKVVALYTSRDRAITEPGLEARDKARRAPDLPDLLARHVLAWDHLWERCDLRISGH